MSLGADHGQHPRIVVGRGALLAGIGLALGVAVVVAVSRQLVALLYGTSATDPWILGGTALLLFLVTLAADFFPARRASELEPQSGLRTTRHAHGERPNGGSDRRPAPQKSPSTTAAESIVLALGFGALAAALAVAKGGPRRAPPTASPLVWWSRGVVEKDGKVDDSGASRR